MVPNSQVEAEYKLSKNHSRFVSKKGKKKKKKKE